MTEKFPYPEQAVINPDSQQALGSVGVFGVMRENPIGEETLGTTRTVAETANYQGNWMLAQQDRMANPDFQAKYDGFVQASIPSLRQGEPTAFDKPDQFQTYHQTLADTVASRRHHIYSAVGYAPAKSFGLSPHQTGRGEIGQQGTVFSDAETMDGQPLTGRQKDIIAAHEAYHGIVKAPGPAVEDLSRGFDAEVYSSIINERALKQPGYLRKPDELMARMAQLKNYYGMKGGEEFTKQHLDYARSHYVEDTGLDNSMSLMMEMVSPRTEQDFLRLMNTLPV